MHRSILSAALVALVGLLVPASALASSVYLNGTRIDGVTNQKFEKATVRIDEKGDVFIEAPGYAVRVLSQPTPTPAPPAGASARGGSATAARPKGRMRRLRWPRLRWRPRLQWLRPPLPWRRLPPRLPRRLRTPPRPSPRAPRASPGATGW